MQLTPAGHAKADALADSEADPKKSLGIPRPLRMISVRALADSHPHLAGEKSPFGSEQVPKAYALDTKAYVLEAKAYALADTCPSAPFA